MRMRSLNGVLAGPPHIDPNTNGLPGVGEAEKIVGALLTFGVIAAVAGLVVAAIVWAFGGHSANPALVHRGKSGVLVALVAALLIGAANVLVQFFWNAGTGL
ncbi:DUF6112 family protein [Jatrophihabitans cynanchi]|uniref:DUF6112 family protein n=1 Tax=Jatrophihabitans cynanchi TaxID=2944128 RepID=A0ABY7JVB8_9ACTN|nr:DUF6112 family protein [Jatrophihabitans sp. SB3-54]WAX55124.1 DUF6112 family protein [Jatrophihabitans sp. SB3-54]